MRAVNERSFDAVRRPLYAHRSGIAIYCFIRHLRVIALPVHQHSKVGSGGCGASNYALTRRRLAEW
jgi:hypothetical protein